VKPRATILFTVLVFVAASLKIVSLLLPQDIRKPSNRESMHPTDCPKQPMVTLRPRWTSHLRIKVVKVPLSDGSVLQVNIVDWRSPTTNTGLFTNRPQTPILAP
jgi:hypothetical protein